MTSPDNHSTSTEISGLRPDEGPQDLATRREEKGLSLEEVYARTRISMKTLSAIESGDFAALPPPVYTKAFIKQYAAFIGADPQPVMMRYAAYLKAQEDPHPARKSETPEGPSRGFKFRKLLWPVAGILIVLVALWLYQFDPYGWQSVDSPRENIAEKPESPVLTPPATPIVAEPAQPENASDATAAAPVILQSEALPPATTKPVVPTPELQKMTITARDTTWIGIRIDDQEGLRALLKPGDTVTYTGTQFRMDIGNAGGIDVTLQGKPIAPLGKSGQVVHVTLP